MFEGLKQKAEESRRMIMALFAGALSLMFTQTLVTYLNTKLNEFNIFGLDPQIFELIAIGVTLIILMWFGVLKQPATKESMK